MAGNAIAHISATAQSPVSTSMATYSPKWSASTWAGCPAGISPCSSEPPPCGVCAGGPMSLLLSFAPLSKHTATSDILRLRGGCQQWNDSLRHQTGTGRRSLFGLMQDDGNSPGAIDKGLRGSRTQDQLRPIGHHPLVDATPNCSTAEILCRVQR